MLEQLRQRLRALEKPAGIEEGPGVLPLGVTAVDDALEGGLLRGALHEIAAASEAHLPTATGFALGLSCLSWPGLSRPSRLEGDCVPDRDARHKAGHDSNIVWIAEDMALAESGAPYGLGLDAFGLAPERLLTVTAARPRDLFWAMEEALRCRAVRAVIGEWRHGVINMVTQRRLSLAAAESGALALLLRASPTDDASTAATRWIVSASPSPARGEKESRIDLAVRLVRNRRGPTGSWIIEWSDSDERFLPATPAQPVAAPAFDRPYRQIAQQVA